MADIDFLVLEYGRGRVVALVEYKHYLACAVDESHPSLRALKWLANVAHLPFFEVRYRRGLPRPWSESRWKVIPRNGLAERIMSEVATMTEREYVTLLYKLRDLGEPFMLWKSLENMDGTPQASEGMDFLCNDGVLRPEEETDAIP